MGVYISGMDMPKEGSWKTVRIYPDGTCAVPNWQGDCTVIKGAKAVPVPTHGRSIDADELLTLCRDYAITPDGAEEPEFVYDIGVHGANGMFRFCLTLEPTEDGGYSGREQDYVTDVYEIWQGYRTHSAYDFTITFCDGQGTVIGQLDDSYEGEDSE